MGIVVVLKHRTFPGLPELCAYRHPISNLTIILRRGERGYHIAIKQFNPDKYNRERGISAAQAEAMFNGAAFGWHYPGSNPQNYDSNGHFISKKSQSL